MEASKSADCCLSFKFLTKYFLLSTELLTYTTSDCLFSKWMYNIVTKIGDGNLGWIEQKPFDRIILTAATKKLSKEITEQIKNNGIIVAPMIISNEKQILKKFIKKNNKIIEKEIANVMFVPNLKGVKK